jgi:N-acyl homoserine lactone hydrolase
MMLNKKKIIVFIVLFTLLIMLLFAGSILSTSNFFHEYIDVKNYRARPWERILLNPSTITVEPYVTGYIAIQKGGAINLFHQKAKGIKDDKVIVPVLSYLLYHEKFGYYLIDTGLDMSYQKNPYGRNKGLLVKYLSVRGFQMKGTSMSEIINKNNFKLEGIFLTHMHFDHISGITDLPKYLKVIAGKNESYNNYRFLYYGDQLGGIKKIYEVDYKSPDIKEMEPFDNCYDFFGDGSLWLIHTPGHTDGHTSFLINTRKGPVLISGDSCLLKYGFNKGIGPGYYSNDINTAQKSLDKIISFKKKFPKLKIFFGHDFLSE